MAGIIQKELDLQKTNFLTFDTDWAPDFIIDEVSSVLIANKIKIPLPYRVDKSVLYPTIVNGARLEQLKTSYIIKICETEINK